jgi:hypothetical protein
VATPQNLTATFDYHNRQFKDTWPIALPRNAIVKHRKWCDSYTAVCSSMHKGTHLPTSHEEMKASGPQAPIQFSSRPKRSPWQILCNNIDPCNTLCLARVESEHVQSLPQLDEHHSCDTVPAVSMLPFRLDSARMQGSSSLISRVSETSIRSGR